MNDLSAFSPRRILVCQQRQIGDVLLTVPVFRALRKRFPQAELHLFTEKKCEPLLRHHPCIDAFHLIDKKDGLFQQLAFYRKVAACRFDLVIDLQQLPRCRAMTLLSRAPVRLSFPSSPLIHWRYTHLTEPEDGYASQTKVSLLKPLGIRWDGFGPDIHFLAEEREKARELLRASGWHRGRLVSIDSTHRRPSKRWPAERFAALIHKLSVQEDDLCFLLLRGPGEDKAIVALRELCLRLGIASEKLCVPAQIPDIRLSAACIAEAALHIGCCSSPRHIAAAVGTPSLVIPGASGMAWRLPSEKHQELRPALSCQPCSRVDCPAPKCLLQVTPDMALLKALEMLKAFSSNA